MKADLVLKNGVIYKADSARTIAEALAVADGKIIYVGDNNGVNEYITETTEIVDLQGKLVLPSFFEGHTHYTKATATVVGINLAGMNTEAEYVESCRNFIAARTLESSCCVGKDIWKHVFRGKDRTKKLLIKLQLKFLLLCRLKLCILYGLTLKQ